MSKSSVKTDAKGNVIFPDFKSEREEAEWWDRNSNFFMERLRKHGKAVYPTAPKTQPVTIRIDAALIGEAKRIAAERGLGYQTLLKNAMREGLKREGANL